MNIYDSLFFPDELLNEQIANHIFQSLGENCPLVLILDNARNIHPSNPEKFSRISTDKLMLQEICDRIDDGFEPAIISQEGILIAGAQLATDQTNCGYVLLVMENSNSDMLPDHSSVLEAVFCQFNLVARLVTVNNFFRELQMKHFSEYAHSATTLN